MRKAWSIVIKMFMEHSHDKFMDRFDENTCHIVITRVMEYFSDKGMEHCDDKGHGAL